MRRVILLLSFFQSASAVTHSLKYLCTASSGVPNFPKFVSVGLVDDVQINYYDSNTKRAEPRQDWMEKVTADDPQYWEKETNASVVHQMNFTTNIEIAKQSFNQTEGVHTYQRLYSCVWDDETDDFNGFYRDGYDGENFSTFDLKRGTYRHLKKEALRTVIKWDNDRAWREMQKHYLTRICPEWLKKYVDYGRSSLLRTALPSVFLLQQTPSSPVRCFASGFYPKRASLFWRKDGDDLHEDVEHGEILPNTDGTFQMSVDLKVSSVTPEDWRRYECVFQLSGVKDDIVTKLDKTVIKTSYETPSNTAAITAAVVVALVFFAVGFGTYWCSRNEKDSLADTAQDFGSSPSISSDGSVDSSTPLVNNREHEPVRTKEYIGTVPTLEISLNGTHDRKTSFNM